MSNVQEILYDVVDNGFATVRLPQLLRYLRKGNRAAGTWRALLDEWEGIDQVRSELRIVELPREIILLTNMPSYRVSTWADDN